MKRQEIMELLKGIANRIIGKKSKKAPELAQITPTTTLTPEVNQVETLQPDAVIIEEPAPAETPRTSVKVSVVAEGRVNVNVDVSADADVEVSVKVKKKAKPYTYIPHDYRTMCDGILRDKDGEGTRYMEVFHPRQLTNLTGSELDLLLEGIDLMDEEAKYVDAEQKYPTERQIIIYREVSAICEAIGAGTCSVKPLTYRDYHFAIVGVIKALNRYIETHPNSPEVQSIC